MNKERLEIRWRDNAHWVQSSWNSEYAGSMATERGIEFLLQEYILHDRLYDRVPEEILDDEARNLSE
jgi:hypothetical protein